MPNLSIEEIIALFDSAPILEYVLYFALFNLAITFIEIIIDLSTSKERRWKDTGANIIIFIAAQLLENSAIAAIGLIGLFPFYYLSPLSIPMTIGSWALGVLVADFTYYWMHRFEHEHRILWAHHSVHHSSEDYNLTVAMRLSIIEGAVEWIFLIPMVLIGFNPFQTILCMIFVAQYQTWIHTETVRKLGWLDKVFNTPSVHRVHHGSNEKYLDKNYGGILIIWDRLFGTYEPESEKVVYGLTKNIKTNNPIAINFGEYLNIWRDLKKHKGWRAKWRVVFGPLRED